MNFITGFYEKNDSTLWLSYYGKGIIEHKQKSIKGFTESYNCTKLVYFETYQYIQDAIQREKNIKKWKREWKDKLIKEKNENFDDISKDWGIIKNLKL